MAQEDEGACQTPRAPSTDHRRREEFKAQPTVCSGAAQATAEGPLGGKGATPTEPRKRWLSHPDPQQQLLYLSFPCSENNASLQHLMLFCYIKMILSAANDA